MEYQASRGIAARPRRRRREGHPRHPRRLPRWKATSSARPRTASAALSELERRSYDLVISDLKMPGMGGIELLEEIADATPNVAHRDHDRLRHRRDRDRRDEEGRLRLHPQAVQGRGGRPRRRSAASRGSGCTPRTSGSTRRSRSTRSARRSRESSSLDTILDVILDAARRGRSADVVTLLLEDGAGRFVERIAQALDPTGRRRSYIGDAQPRRGCSSTIRKTRPLLEHGVKALRVLRRAAQGQAAGLVLLDPAQGAGPRHRHAQRVSLHARQKFDEGQRKMLVGRWLARGGRDRERAPLRRSGQRTRT